MELSKFYEIKKIEDMCINTDLVLPQFIKMTEELICSICLQIVWDPEICVKCSTPFGKVCLNSWFKKNKKCPKQCEFERCEIPHLLKRIMNNIEFFCQYKSQGCSKILNYENFYKHINNCSYGIYKCKNCQAEGDEEFIKSHEYECEFNFVRCEKCTYSFRLKEIYDHNNNMNECFSNSVRALNSLSIDFESIKIKYNDLINSKLDKIGISQNDSFTILNNNKKSISFSQPSLDFRIKKKNCCHGLSFQNICTTDLTIGCDKCRTNGLKAWWGCRVCDYDLCFKCIRKEYPKEKIITCKSNHDLDVYDISESNLKYFCDICSQKIEDNFTFSCRLCSYDICLECFRKKYERLKNCVIF